MKALLCIALCSLALSSIASAQTPRPTPSSASVSELLKGGTPIDVVFNEDVSSANATQGATVPVTVTKEVDVNGMLVIPKGSTGQATLTTVEGAHGNGSGGKIVFTVDWVYSADGGKVQLSDNDNTSKNADRKGAASTLAIAGYLTFGVLGLFSHNIARGKDAVIPAGKVFSVFVDHDVLVATNQPATAESGFDRPAP